MGDSILGFVKWLLQVDIRWKNGLSLFLALLSTIAFYFGARHSEWFREIETRWDKAILLVLAFALLTSFLFAWLILSVIIGVVMHHRSVNETALMEFEKLKKIHETLGATTDWQRSFLLRFIYGDTTQIKEWEVGPYKAVWGPEVEVLCAKGIIMEHPSGVLEIAPEYRKFLKAFWNPRTKMLEFNVASPSEDSPRPPV